MAAPSKELALTIADPAGMANQLAGLYRDFQRVIMEYIDNAIDDAQDVAHETGGAYPWHLKVHVLLDAGSRTVTVTDNARGIPLDKLEGIATRIGKSTKKASPWLNGQFGFGVHAFRGFAHRIRFQTKTAQGPHYALQFSRDDDRFPGPKVVEDPFPTDTGTGTVVTVSDFDEDAFEALGTDVVREEIEAHFETLLGRTDLTVTVALEGGPTLTCQPFDYTAVPGATFMEKATIMHKGAAREVEIFLKVTDQPSKRRPRIFRKGRRLLELRDLPTLYQKSKRKLAVWDHPNLTGYVEVGDLISPAITRDKTTPADRKACSALAAAVLTFEEEVADAITAINRRYNDDSLGQLEDLLMRELRRIAAADALRFRTELVPAPGSVPLADGGSSPKPEGGGPGDGDGGHGGPLGGPGEGAGPGPGGKEPGKLPGSNGGGGVAPKPGVGPKTGTQRPKPGFGIKFQNIPPDAEGNTARSQFNAGTIYINVGHPDFEARLKHGQKGGVKVTERMVAYVAGVVSVHYKDQFYNKYKKVPEARTQLFDQQLDFIFRFEQALIPHLKTLEKMMTLEEQDGDAAGD